MTVLKPESEFGECVPPVTKHGITTFLPTWEAAMKLRDGDQALFARLQNMYPRFMPWKDARLLIDALGKKLSIPDGYAGYAFMQPGVFSLIETHAFAEERGTHRLLPGELEFRIVDVRGIRLYLVYFPLKRVRGVSDVWQDTGIGISIRLAEYLLEGIDSTVVLEYTPGNLPAPSYVPEEPSHEELRRRTCYWFNRAPINPDGAPLSPGDVYLYATGMASIYYLHEQLTRYRPGYAIVLGSVFHNTFHHLRNQSGQMYKQFGAVDDTGLSIFESWLRGETGDKGDSVVSYVFLEFPSNPILATVDLHRVQHLAREHGFVLVVDDTIGSAANIDVLPACDVVITSLTKTFSGYADVMGGSAALNPASPHYPALKSAYDASFRNEVFGGDASVLLANNEDYLARSAKVGRNAVLLAEHLRATSLSAASPVTLVRHPSVLPDGQVYRRFLRPATDEYEPTYPCLMAVDFESAETTRAFYDALAVYPGPHLGAHKTLCLCYNALLFGRDEKEREEQAAIGAVQESVRVSVGLEDWEDLRDTFDLALEAARKARPEWR